MNNISLRIHTIHWKDRDKFKELCSLLDEYKDVIYEVAFFTSSTHPPLPLDKIREYSKCFTDYAIPSIRDLGMSVGINHLATIGHLDENLENSLNEPWQHLVDISGKVSASCYCASDPQFQNYIRESYAALASSNPDFIWIDDDVRMEHHPKSILYSCFCQYCLDEFQRETGLFYTIDTLRDAFNSGMVDDKLLIRRQWLDHNSRYITRILSIIRNAVSAVNGNIKLGLMTGETGYSTYDYARRTKAMAGIGLVEVKWRPGGGFYSDDAPLAALGKAHSVGRQTAAVPIAVTDVQYEHENFPYQTMKKSRSIFAGEIFAAIGAGCTGVALNILDMYDSSRRAVSYLDKMRDVKNFITSAAETFGRSFCRGIGVPYKIDHFSSLNIDGKWESSGTWGEDFSRYESLAGIGLPMSYSTEGCDVSIITRESCNEYTIDELKNFLSKGAMIDAYTLSKLIELGLGDLCGFDIAGRKDIDSIEFFISHRLNGDFAGCHRDCRPSFYPEPVWLLKPTDNKSEVLSQVIDFNGTVYGCASGVYENILGGRVAIFGYYPWRMIENIAKVYQLKEIVKWLSFDKIPAYVSSYHRSALWCRNEGLGNPAFLLLNPTSDTIDDIELSVFDGSDEINLTDIYGANYEISAKSKHGNYRSYLPGEIGPWQALLIKMRK